MKAANVLAAALILGLACGGRRGGGLSATGSFSLSASGNTAGNEERLGEAVRFRGGGRRGGGRMTQSSFFLGSTGNTAGRRYTGPDTYLTPIAGNEEEHALRDALDSMDANDLDADVASLDSERLGEFGGVPVWFESSATPASLGEVEVDVHEKSSELLRPGMTVALRGAGGNWCGSTVAEGKVNSHCSSAKVGVWEKFLVVDAGDGYIGLKAGDSKCTMSDGSVVECTREHISERQMMKPIDAGKDKVAFRNKATGKLCPSHGVLKCVVADSILSLIHI